MKSKYLQSYIEESEQRVRYGLAPKTVNNHIKFIANKQPNIKTIVCLQNSLRELGWVLYFDKAFIHAYFKFPKSDTFRMAVFRAQVK